MSKEEAPTDHIAGLVLDPQPGTETELDPNVLAQLPEGSEILSITAFRGSLWVSTVRIEIKQRDGTLKKYFQKAQTGSIAKRMMLGTYESEKAFSDYIPEHVPKPIAWGNYKADASTYFYLAEFHSMRDEVANPAAFARVVSKYHKDSMGHSPNGQFGFHVPTHLANIPNDNTWQDTWEHWYTNAMRRMFDLEDELHEKEAEFEDLKEKIFTKVIPRLLRPLETGGRKLKPCLVHSDLWPGNCMPDADTGKVMLFDSCGFWGHNEADMGTWTAPRYLMGRPFFEEYNKLMTISEPKEDWDDRNALYSLRYDLLWSILHSDGNGLKYRRFATETMKRLTEKYPNGFDDFREPKTDAATTSALKTNGDLKSGRDILVHESEMAGSEEPKIMAQREIVAGH